LTPDRDSLDDRADSITAIYRVTKNEFGEWVAEVQRWEEFP